MTYSNSFSQSFTLTNAKYLASKVAADLKRIQRFYGKPSDQRITNYELELIALLHHGYLEKVTYGFQRNGNWIEPTLIYTAKKLAVMYATDDDPGSIRPGADVSGANFRSFLSYSNAWDKLSSDEQTKFESSLPFQRGTGSEPGINGRIENDHTYSSGGRSLNRGSVKKY